MYLIYLMHPVHHHQEEEVETKKIIILDTQL